MPRRPSRRQQSSSSSESSTSSSESECRHRIRTLRKKLTLAKKKIARITRERDAYRRELEEIATNSARAFLESRTTTTMPSSPVTVAPVERQPPPAPRRIPVSFADRPPAPQSPSVISLLSEEDYESDEDEEPPVLFMPATFNEIFEDGDGYCAYFCRDPDHASAYFKVGPLEASIEMAEECIVCYDNAGFYFRCRQCSKICCSECLIQLRPQSSEEVRCPACRGKIN